MTTTKPNVKVKQIWYYTSPSGLPSARYEVVNLFGTEELSANLRRIPTNSNLTCSARVREMAEQDSWACVGVQTSRGMVLVGERRISSGGAFGLRVQSVTDDGVMACDVRATGEESGSVWWNAETVASETVPVAVHDDKRASAASSTQPTTTKPSAVEIGQIWLSSGCSYVVGDHRDPLTKGLTMSFDSKARLPIYSTKTLLPSDNWSCIGFEVKPYGDRVMVGEYRQPPPEDGIKGIVKVVRIIAGRYVTVTDGCGQRSSWSASYVATWPLRTQDEVGAERLLAHGSRLTAQAEERAKSRVSPLADTVQPPAFDERRVDAPSFNTSVAAWVASAAQPSSELTYPQRVKETKDLLSSMLQMKPVKPARRKPRTVEIGQLWQQKDETSTCLVYVRDRNNMFLLQRHDRNILASSALLLANDDDWSCVGFQCPDGRVMVRERRERPSVGEQQAGPVTVVFVEDVHVVVSDDRGLDRWPAAAVASWPLLVDDARIEAKPRFAGSVSVREASKIAATRSAPGNAQGKAVTFDVDGVDERSVADRKLDDDARKHPDYAAARKAAIVALFERGKDGSQVSNPLWLVEAALTRLHDYERLRGHRTKPSAEAVSMVERLGQGSAWPLIFVVYERVRTFA